MAIFFVDSLDAYHFEKIINSDGSTSNRRMSLPFQHNLHCQISYQSLDSASPKGDVTYPQKRPLEIFVKGIGHGFERGDWIVVKRNGVAEYEGAIGEPRFYDRLIVHTELGIEAWKKVNGF